MKVIGITFIVFCCMIMLRPEAHETTFFRDYHLEGRGKNRQGDKWEGRAASDSDSPLTASGSTMTIALERRPHVPHHHEWSASGSVSCSDEDYEGGWYIYATAGDDTEAPPCVTLLFLYLQIELNT